MELTVGTALQGGKYVIQEVLRQNDVEVMYRALHTYLDQPVLLRSLNPLHQQRDDFAQVKQKFVAKVRSQARQAISSAPVLDCFEEGNLPFVVLQFPAEKFSSTSHPQPVVLSSPTHQPVEATSLQESSLQESAVPDLVQAFDAAFSANTRQQAAVANPSVVAQPVAPQPTTVDQASPRRDYEPIVFHPVSGTTLAAAPNGHQSLDPKSARSLRQRFTGLPIALLVVSLIGGCIGVGTGLALRYDAAQPQAGNKPRLSLFNREQSFPAEGNWPVQESYAPEPMIEQPLYRATPSPDYAPSTPIQPLPSETAPSLEPNIEATKSLPETFELPSDGVPPASSESKLPSESAPLPELGNASEIPRPTERMQPISPDNLLPPTTVAPAPIPPPADAPSAAPPPLKSLPDSSGI